MVSYFQGSVAGLDVGADVTLHGLKIGEVTDLGLVFDSSKQRILVPVHYVVEGDRVAGVAGQTADVPPGLVAAEMVRRGFRATLDTTSLITGTKVVSLRFVADACPRARPAGWTPSPARPPSCSPR
jgi:paraquat-inducible protein B